MAQENGMTRRGLLTAAGVAGVAALGAAALLPSQAQASIDDYPGLKDAARPLERRQISPDQGLRQVRRPQEERAGAHRSGHRRDQGVLAIRRREVNVPVPLRRGSPRRSIRFLSAPDGSIGGVQ